MIPLLNIGDKVPDFEIPLAFADGKKEKVKFSSLLGHGPVVIAFYPLAFSGICTTENCQLRDNQSFFDHLEAKTIGFSTDTPFANIQFAKTNNLRHGLFSDANFEAVEQIWQTAPVAGWTHRATRGRRARCSGSDGCGTASSARAVAREYWIRS